MLALLLAPAVVRAVPADQVYGDVIAVEERDVDYVSDSSFASHAASPGHPRLDSLEAGFMGEGND